MAAESVATELSATPPLSQRAFARRVGVSEGNVRQAIRNGRLERSVGMVEGELVITDVAMAEREWHENRDVVKAHQPGPVAPVQPGTIAAARKRLLEAQARREEVAGAVKDGTLVNAKAVETRWATRVLRARTQMLGHATRAKQRLPHLSASDLIVLDELIREALNELGDEGDA